tara:strand:- start:896 stop:1147 length:252 start_codon:yes stop_codon:yes gene_type:complete
MQLSKKKSPTVKDANLTRVLNQVYDDINEIINAVNSGQVTVEDKPSTGKTGDIRLIRLGDGSYELQGKATEGWVASTMVYKEN